MAKLRDLKISNDRLTNRTENTSRYFSEVERIKMLKPEEEFKVASLAQKGDEEAIDILIKANLRFVVSVAKQYANSKTSLDELICQGNIGLIYSARTFDATRGFRFISYAVWHIRREILHYLSYSSREVKVPQNVLTTLSRIKKIDEVSLQTEGRPATVEEIQKILQEEGKTLSEDQLKSIMFSDGNFTSLETSDIEDTNSPIDWLQSESNALSRVENMDIQVVVSQLTSVLSPVQREIVIRKIGIGRAEPETFVMIGERFGKSSEWARQTYDKSIRKMKARFIARASQMNVLN